MSLTKFEKDVENIIKLPNVVKDQPQTLKQTFDKAGVDIKEYINDTLTEELDNTISALDGDVVKLDGDQTIDDTKTYLKNIVADTPPTLDDHLTNKLYVDTLDSENVKLTGSQTIAGVKTFSSSPIVPTPTTDAQASSKSYVDTVDANRKTYVDSNFYNRNILETEFVRKSEIEVESSIKIIYEVFTIVNANIDGLTFSYINKDGNTIIGELDIDGYQIFDLEQGEYLLNQNVVGAYINDTLHRSKASGGLKEVASNKVGIAPELAGAEITIQYYEVQGFLASGIIVSDAQPTNTFFGKFWLDTGV